MLQMFGSRPSSSWILIDGFTYIGHVYCSEVLDRDTRALNINWKGWSWYWCRRYRHHDVERRRQEILWLSGIDGTNCRSCDSVWSERISGQARQTKLLQTHPQASQEQNAWCASTKCGEKLWLIIQDMMHLAWLMMNHFPLRICCLQSHTPLCAHIYFSTPIHESICIYSHMPVHV